MFTVLHHTSTFCWDFRNLQTCVKLYLNKEFSKYLIVHIPFSILQLRKLLKSLNKNILEWNWIEIKIFLHLLKTKLFHYFTKIAEERFRIWSKIHVAQILAKKLKIQYKLIILCNKIIKKSWFEWKKWLNQQFRFREG